MVAVRPNPGNAVFSLKPKQAKEIGKKVLSSKVHCQAVVCGEGAFTAEWYANRQKIVEALSLYRKLLVNKKLLAKLSQELLHEKSLDGRKCYGLGLHMRAARILESLGKWVNTSKQIGHVSGVSVGDEFHWRGELSVVGLHHDFQKGIDCMKLINGKTLATSIVDSGRYENDVGITAEMTYCGEGENPNLYRARKPKDQKLKGGNHALRNNMDGKLPVRVIRRIDNTGNSMVADKGNDCGYKFVYDGLYRVTSFWKELGNFGRYVYKFKLKRIEGQPELDLGKWKKVRNGSVGSVSQGKENYSHYRRY